MSTRPEGVGLSEVDGGSIVLVVIVVADDPARVPALQDSDGTLVVGRLLAADTSTDTTQSPLTTNFLTQKPNQISGAEGSRTPDLSLECATSVEAPHSSNERARWHGRE